MMRASKFQYRLAVTAVCFLCGCAAANADLPSDPTWVNPKSWAQWKRAIGPAAWQQYLDGLTMNQRLWLRANLSPENWRRWRERMNAADEQIVLECTTPPACVQVRTPVGPDLQQPSK